MWADTERPCGKDKGAGLWTQLSWQRACLGYTRTWVHTQQSTHSGVVVLASSQHWSGENRGRDKGRGRQGRGRVRSRKKGRDRGRGRGKGRGEGEERQGKRQRQGRGRGREKAEETGRNRERGRQRGRGRERGRVRRIKEYKVILFYTLSSSPAWTNETLSQTK